MGSRERLIDTKRERETDRTLGHSQNHFIWTHTHNTARQWRRVLTKNFWKMGIGVVPRVYKGSALTIQVAASFPLIGTLQFRVRSLFSYVFCGRIIRGDLFSLTAGRTLAFRRHHGGMIHQSKWVKVFEGEDTTKKRKRKECFVLVTWKEPL